MEKRNEIWKKTKSPKEARNLAYEFTTNHLDELVEKALRNRDHFVYEGHFTNDATWSISIKFKEAGYQVRMLQKTFSIQGFREITLDFCSKTPSDGILFANGDDKSEGFQFKILKSGTTKINHAGTGDLHCIVNYYNPEEVTYTGSDVTVAVTSYNQNQLTGTFSGKLANVYYNSGSVFPDVKGAKIAKNYPQFIQITDGKFDLQQ